MGDVFHDEVGQGKGRLKKATDISVMETGGSRGHFELFNKGFVFPEETKELVKIWVLDLLASLHKTQKHRIDILLRHGKEVREKDPFLFYSVNMGDIQLKMILERGRLSFHLDKVVFLENS